MRLFRPPLQRHLLMIDRKTGFPKRQMTLVIVIYFLQFLQKQYAMLRKGKIAFLGQPGPHEICRFDAFFGP